MEDVKVTPELSPSEQLAAIQLEIAKKTLEALELEQKERTYHIQDLQATISERDIKEKQRKENREAQGKTFAQEEATDLYRWSVCTHKKGGTASQRDMRCISTGGNSAQYAVIKHQMINGDLWVRCLRCGKTWCPPVEAMFYFDAKGKQVAVAEDR